MKLTLGNVLIGAAIFGAAFYLGRKSLDASDFLEGGKES